MALKAAMFACTRCDNDHSFLWDDAKPTSEDFRRTLVKHSTGEIRCSHTRKRGSKLEKCGGALREVQHPLMKPGAEARLLASAAEHEATMAAVVAHPNYKAPEAEAEPEKAFVGPRPGVNDGIKVQRDGAPRPAGGETLTDGPRPAA